MSQDASGGGEPFDLGKLKELVELMELHDLTEVSLRRGDEKWRLRRGGRDVVQMVPAPAASMVPSPAQGSAAPAAESTAKALPPGTIEITSPTVGTFYAAPSPDDPAFVSIGSKIQPDTIVCIVEAMKVFNQIPAEVDGTIVEILVKNGDPVEFGQALFRVRVG